MLTSQSVGLESADYILLTRDKLPPTQKGVLAMTLNCIWWWRSSSGDLGTMEYPFIAITLRSNLTWSGSNC